MAATALTACVPTPKPHTIDIVGDSLAVQASWQREAAFLAGAPARADVVLDVRAGIGLPDVLAGQRDRVATGRPAILVIALGTNDAGPVDGGWTVSDERELRNLLAAPSPKACIVLVLPGHADKPAVTSTYRADLKAARAAIRTEAADRSALGRPTVVADWGAVALTRPELTRADGIHLADEAAADAWTNVLWAGVKRCPAP